jgi:hypothetical protein
MTAKKTTTANTARVVNEPDVAEGVVAPRSAVRAHLVRILHDHRNETSTFEDVAEAILDAGWSSLEDTNSLRNQAIAYNSLMWRLAVAFGIASEGDKVIDVDLVELADLAVAAAVSWVQTEAGETDA